MTFTGKNLFLLRDALARALSDVHTEHATAYSTDDDEDDALKEEAKQYKKLLVRVNAALLKEPT